MRLLLKFLHSLAGAGLLGGALAMAVVALWAQRPESAAAHAPTIAALAQMAAWIIGPSMVLTIVTGLLAMAVTRAFQDVGWAWAKAATGILVLEIGLHVMGPIQEEAKRSAGQLAATADPASAAQLLAAEANTLLLLAGVAAVNVALGVWRPKFPKYTVR